MRSGDYSKNLRLLCNEFGTVADVCRGIDINRQQFNKYLSGKVLPDQHNQRRISQFFNLDRAVLILPHHEFRQLRVSSQRGEELTSGYTHFFEQMLNALPNDLDKLRRYIGYYYVWFHAGGFDGYIIKSLLSVYEKDGAILTKGIEHLTSDTDRDGSYRGKYKGALYYVNDRLFMLDYESQINHTMSLTILSATHRNKITSLHGVGVGIASRSACDPYACRTEWEYLGVDINVREALQSCQLYPHDSAQIDDHRKKKISNKIATGEFLLRGLVI